MNNQRLELEKLIRTLQKNRAMVSLEDLTTKYAKPYADLLLSIRRAAGAYFTALVFVWPEYIGTRISEDYEDQVKDIVNTVSTPEKNLELWEIIVDEFNLAKAEALAKERHEYFVSLIDDLFQSSLVYISDARMDGYVVYSRMTGKIFDQQHVRWVDLPDELSWIRTLPLRR